MDHCKTRKFLLLSPFKKNKKPNFYDAPLPGFSYKPTLPNSSRGTYPLIKKIPSAPIKTKIRKQIKKLNRSQKTFYLFPLQKTISNSWVHTTTNFQANSYFLFSFLLPSHFWNKKKSKTGKQTGTHRKTKIAHSQPK